MKFLVLSMLFVSIALINSLSIPGITGPLHASCKVSWTWPANDCASIQKSLVDQINKWSTEDNCKNGGEKCLYTLKEQNSTGLSATHQTPVKHYVDDLTFSFAPLNNSGCTGQGFSTSEIWYALLDFGTNYCNLNNLITGAELDQLKGYAETTDDNICTQHSSANCTVY